MHPLARRSVDLERDNERLRHRLEQQEAIIEVQEEVSSMRPFTSPTLASSTRLGHRYRRYRHCTFRIGS